MPFRVNRPHATLPNGANDPIATVLKRGVWGEHNLSLEIYDLRFTIYDLRFTIYDLRFTIYDLRLVNEWMDA